MHEKRASESAVNDGKDGKLPDGVCSGREGGGERGWAGACEACLRGWCVGEGRRGRGAELRRGMSSFGLEIIVAGFRNSTMKWLMGHFRRGFPT